MITALGIGVRVLVRRERSNSAESAGELGIERGHVVGVTALLICIAEQKALIQKLDASPFIDHICVDDGLPQPHTGSLQEVADAVVIDGSAHLQARSEVGAEKETHV